MKIDFDKTWMFVDWKKVKEYSKYFLIGRQNWTTLRSLWKLCWIPCCKIIKILNK